MTAGAKARIQRHHHEPSQLVNSHHVLSDDFGAVLSLDTGGEPFFDGLGVKHGLRSAIVLKNIE
jgi:hypothetical protein